MPPRTLPLEVDEDNNWYIFVYLSICKFAYLSICVYCGRATGTKANLKWRKLQIRSLNETLMPHQLRSYFLSQFAKVGCFFAVYKFVSGPCFLCDAVYMTDIDDKASLIVSSSESVSVQSCTWYSLPILVGTLSQCIKIIWNTFSVYQYYLILFLSVSRLFDILSQHLVYQDYLTHFLSGVSRCCSTPMGGFTLPLAKLHIRRLKWAAFLHYIYTIPYHTTPNHTKSNYTIHIVTNEHPSFLHCYLTYIPYHSIASHTIPYYTTP